MWPSALAVHMKTINRFGLTISQLGTVWTASLAAQSNGLGTFYAATRLAACKDDSAKNIPHKLGFYIRAF